MSLEKIKEDLRIIRNLNRRGLCNELTEQYKELFSQLPPLEQSVMIECYVKGKSYSDCGCKIAYCERQVFRIVHNSIKLLNENDELKREQ